MPEHFLDKKLINLGNRLFEAFHLLGLFVIGAAILWASWVEVFVIIAQGGPEIKDVLLLFICLELGAMVDIKTLSDMHMITLSGAILILCIAVLVLRIGSARFGESGPMDA